MLCIRSCELPSGLFCLFTITPNAFGCETVICTVHLLHCGSFSPWLCSAGYKLSSIHFHSFTVAPFHSSCVLQVMYCHLHSSKPSLWLFPTIVLQLGDVFTEAFSPLAMCCRIYAMVCTSPLLPFDPFLPWLCVAGFVLSAEFRSHMAPFLSASVLQDIH